MVKNTEKAQKVAKNKPRTIRKVAKSLLKTMQKVAKKYKYTALQILYTSC